MFSFVTEKGGSGRFRPTSPQESYSFSFKEENPIKKSEQTASSKCGCDGTVEFDERGLSIPHCFHVWRP